MKEPIDVFKELEKELDKFDEISQIKNQIDDVMRVQGEETTIRQGLRMTFSREINQERDYYAELIAMHLSELRRRQRES